jgi:hypothetical protein|tara:strand:+ start:250 stop:864 length:615 start_codon:yes stop_codon:yes gene_type:complete
MIGKVIGGLSGIASGMIGSGKRKREQRAAQADYDRRKADYENTDTSNVYANMENTMEDLTVNQDQAKFQTEQSQQGLSNIMGSMQGAAGGSGIAALAQSLAGQQQNQVRQASMDIGRQEQSNQMAERSQAGNLQLYEAKGELISRDAEMEKTETLMGMSQQRLGAANAARQEATNSIVGGVGDLASVGAGFVPGKSTLGKILGN